MDAMMCRMKNYIFLLSLLLVSCSSGKIDRKALLARNNPVVHAFDSLSSLSVGNGEFAFTVDASGLQTFPEAYSNGVPLGTQSQWGWHSFPNTSGFHPDEALVGFDFGRGRREVYACQFAEEGRRQDAANYLRANPHRLHLGVIGLSLKPGLGMANITSIHQTLHLETGKITSRFLLDGHPMSVQTLCHPTKDMIAVSVIADSSLLGNAWQGIRFRFPYPTGLHTDDASLWGADDKHTTLFLQTGEDRALLKRIIDDTTYYLDVRWEGKAEMHQEAPNDWLLASDSDTLHFACRFTPQLPSDEEMDSFCATEKQSADYWKHFWNEGAVVDFSDCTDPRASELERRVVLSQYLLAIQSAGSLPPQETGLTYNSWFGKFHLEMIWWHQSWQPLWGHEQLLSRTMKWYEQAELMAREIARRSGFDGVRWMKMTDPSALEAPSDIGSFLIWQQPHYSYLAELLYRVNPAQEVLDEYYYLIQESAAFLSDFLYYDETLDRYVLKGLIPAQETLKPATTLNPPFELSYVHFALQLAQTWRERMGHERLEKWDEQLQKLSSLAHNADSLYLASEDAVDTYTDARFTSDHMAVLGAYGVLPFNRLIDEKMMRNTLHWVYQNWNWNQTWGWDYPMTAMNATRLGEPQLAVNSLLMDKRTNTYLLNGHNYQNESLRCYLPGNGGLLTAIALMCAGWDGCETTNPGFPKDGTWNVRWEGLKPLP